MRSVVQEASPQEQLALIDAHPILGVRGRTRAQPTAASSGRLERGSSPALIAEWIGIKESDFVIDGAGVVKDIEQAANALQEFLLHAPYAA
jgi:hypothetical protein